MIESLFTYKAKYIKNYDGDTITFEIDLGFDLKFTIVVRVLNINTKELRGTRGEDKINAYKAKDFVESKLKNCDDVFIKTVKDKKGKYGRYLAFVYYGNDYVNLGEQLLSEGLAVPYI